VARLYADRTIPVSCCKITAKFGNDVLTVQEAGKANQKIPDEEVLEFAISNNRAVLTLKRPDFIRLHRFNSDHTGIIVCTNDQNWERLAVRINEAISNLETLRSLLIRVNRPSE
jgi:predicted nuclease of predicted toxin-antitoxin system